MPMHYQKDTVRFSDFPFVENNIGWADKYVCNTQVHNSYSTFFRLAEHVNWSRRAHSRSSKVHQSSGTSGWSVEAIQPAVTAIEIHATSRLSRSYRSNVHTYSHVMSSSVSLSAQGTSFTPAIARIVSQIVRLTVSQSGHERKTA